MKIFWFFFMLFVMIQTAKSQSAESDTVWVKEIGSAVKTVKFSPDGQFIYAAAIGRKPMKLSTETGDILQEYEGVTYGGGDDRSNLDISTDGRLLYSGNDGNIMYIWDTETGVVIDTLQTDYEEKEKPYYKSISVSGNYVAALVVYRYLNNHGEYAFNTDTHIWNVDTREKMKVLYSTSGQKNKFSPDGRYLATIKTNDVISFVSSDDWKIYTDFIGHTIVVADIAFSPDGSLIASCGSSGEIKIWDIPNQTLKESLTDYGNLTSIAFLNNSTIVCDGNIDFVNRYTKVWNIDQKEVVGMIKTNKPWDLDVDINSKNCILALTNFVLLFNIDKITSLISEPDIQDIMVSVIPNPANSNTTLVINSYEAINIRIEIVDINSKVVELFRNVQISQGKNEILWNTKNLSSGVYFCRISDKTFSKTFKIILEK